MSKLIGNEWRMGAVLSLAAAAVTVPAASFAGPGCMQENRPMARGFYPHAPMGPQVPYGHRAPYRAYAPAPAYGGMMAAPYGRPMPVHWRNPGGGVMPAVSAPADKSRASEELQAASGESTSGGETVTVRINGMQFEPANITIKPGITVTWVHGSPMPHTVSGNDGGPQSNTLYSGQQYSHTFDATGRYDYVCDFHPSMKGSVIVEPSGTDA